MSELPPALLPLFRSEQQMRLLGVLFAPQAHPISIGELARRADVAQSTASREVARLAEYGIVTDTHIGRTRLVSANRNLPWAHDLEAILAKTIGVPALLATALDDLDGVQGAWIFGSWAARYDGEPGPPPADIDVVVVGTASLRAVRAATKSVEALTSVDVNPVVVDHETWEKAEDSFIANIRSRPLVAVPLKVGTR